MKVLIIEDEELAAARITKLIKEYDPSIQIQARLTSIHSTMEYLQKDNFIDLIFMDIQIADGLSLDLFEKMEVNIPVIFTTAFSEYTLKAFKVNSIDYLLKPIGFKELKAAIEKFKFLNKKYGLIGRESAKEVKQMLHQNFKNRFVVKSGSHTQIIPVGEISCFLSKEQITFLLTKDNRRFPIDYSLEQLESLVSSEMFFRVSRQFLVNINSIEGIVTYFNSRLKINLRNIKEDEIIVSREKVQSFKEWLDK